MEHTRIISNEKRITDPATHKHVRYEGRIVRDNDTGVVRCNWPGINFQCRFVGQYLAIELKGCGDGFDVLVDGKLAKKITTSPQGIRETFALIEADTSTAVTIELIKRTENYVSFCTLFAFHHDGEFEPHPKDHQPHILFIGDSMSAGYASESNTIECSTEEVFDTSNARLAFPYQTARRLGASLAQVSYSGMGLIRNWNGTAPHQHIPDFAFKASAIENDDTHYTEKTPNLVVIEIGTNDFNTPLQAQESWQSLTEFTQAWTQRMVAFVEEIVAHYRNPNGDHDDVNILLAVPTQKLEEAADAAIAKLHALGRAKVYRHTFKIQGKGCARHPIESEHASVADHMSQFIRDYDLL
ncbi:GDSL-type esterase/lipase family protein [Enterovibrio sp. ZSDZ35]|uniref:GDSL-type esterase/lipase family protein n=1 Tax=Enterovibrio qingdaonensis TaxID=2899818 RepID=A0ABT5QKY4_9GAMM|nr:SGNH/GDSL hydrolase family protein [Enterovibrio sp. ZSDZ35]MDD1781140.1 GDSL-type esterase/lipase family protein [Enterovibrio sp. ZSDZ35]